MNPKCYLLEDIGEEIVVADHTVEKPVKLHFHDYYELEIVLSGTGTQVLNGCTCDMTPGTVYLLTPIDFHAVTPKKAMKVLNISFGENAVPTELLLPLSKRRDNLVFFDRERARFMEELARSLKADNEDGYSARRRRCLLELLLVEVLRSRDEAATPEIPDPVSRALSYIFCHFREPMVLQDVSQGYTVTYFSALFRRTCGVGFAAFLEKLRVNFARQLLATTDDNVAVVGRKSGFTSQAAFFRAFHKITGLSPAQYRKQFEY